MPRSHSSASICTGEVVAVQLQTEDDDRPTTRVCDKKLIRNYNALIAYDVTIGTGDEIHLQSRVPTLQFSTEAFDRWHSSVCFGASRTFPRREYLCREIVDRHYMLRDNGMPRAKYTTLGLMLETYCVSQAMGTARASNMIFNEIISKLGAVPVSVILPEEEVF